MRFGGAEARWPAHALFHQFRPLVAPHDSRTAPLASISERIAVSSGSWTRCTSIPKHGLTQEQFSEVSGISYKYYQALEAGRKVDPRLSTVERVAKVYSIRVDQLLAPELAETKVRRIREKTSTA